MINYLPLHEDFVENLTVFRCLVYLYEIGNQYMISLANSIIEASLITLKDKKKYCEDGNINYTILKLIYYILLIKKKKY